MLELSERLSSLLSTPERKKLTEECSIFEKVALPPLVDVYHPDYPPLLREIYDPPLLLSYLGNLSLLKRRLVAIVGTRKASMVSKVATHLLVVKLKSLDPEICIVSGMALGIDRVAFESALSSQLGVIGLLGTSIFDEYPPGNRDLYKRVKASEQSLLLSEFIFPTDPARWTFLKRNRLISGMVTDVCIMESGKKSGTLSTAMSAVSQNREVHVFDHELQFDNAGGKQLLNEGAERLDWEFLSSEKGRIEIPGFFSGRRVLEAEEWKKISDAERRYKMSGKKTPLGRGAYWVEFT